MPGLASYVSVLVVDDEASITMPMKEVLAKAGYNAEGIYEFKDAMKAIQRRRYDCIIVDLNLGKESGEKLVEFLATGKHPNARTPVIVVSSRLNDEAVRRMSGRVTEFVAKPLNFVQMLARVRNLLKMTAVAA